MSDDIIIRVENGVGRITLNRPEALHALNTGMCASVLETLNAWSADAAVRLVLVDHAEGTRGFCAGGDIRMLAESGAKDGAEAFEFFATEYRMNVAIARFPKPYVAVIDGVVMGGGVGISVHGSHRIATERTTFAMPETGIGLFPDVGGGWFLPRLRGELGTWLALTGARLKGTDVAAAKVATHFVPSELVPNLKKQVLSADYDNGAAEMLNEILARLTHSVAPGSFERHMATIDRCFGHDRVEDIVSALEADSDDWAQQQLAALRTKSPRTMKVALRQLRAGAQLETFEDNMRMEFRIGRRQVCSADFIEGVRAVIIDKDNAPRWSPERIEDVSDDLLDEVFAPVGEDELSFA